MNIEEGVKEIEELIKINLFGINFNVCKNCYELCKKFEEIHK